MFALRRVAALLITTSLAAFFCTFVASGTANAYAYDCEYPGQILNIKGVPLPTAEYCAEIDGSRSYIGTVRGNFLSFYPPVCNYDMTAEFFTANWKWVRTFVSPHKNGCAATDGMAMTFPYSINVFTKASNGYMCSTLRSAGKRITSKCLYIHA